MERRPLLNGQVWSRPSRVSWQPSICEQAIVTSTFTEEEIRDFVSLFNTTESPPPLTRRSARRGLGWRNARNSLLTFLHIIFNVAERVMLPVYAGSMVKIGADPYILLSQTTLWFAVLFVLLAGALHMSSRRRFDKLSLHPKTPLKFLSGMGLLMSLSGILTVFASPPDRTPPYLQGLLMIVSIPLTALCRFLILRKSIGGPRVLVAIGIVFGLFITTVPHLFSLPGSSNKYSSSNQSRVSAVLSPIMYILGFLPLCLLTVLSEKELKKGEERTFVFIAWTHVFQFVGTVSMFWSDFIPDFGMAKSPSDFLEHMQSGWYCLFHGDQQCGALSFNAWTFVLVYCLDNICHFLLIQYSEGAMYAAIVNTVVSPMATLFWTLFTYDFELDCLIWNPRFTETTAFTAVGVAMVILGVGIYNYISVTTQEEGPVEHTEPQTAFSSLFP